MFVDSAPLVLRRRAVVRLGLHVSLLWQLVFFFSSRRRHTRFKCDWSSVVCSSDVKGNAGGGTQVLVEFRILHSGCAPKRPRGQEGNISVSTPAFNCQRECPQEWHSGTSRNG